MTKSAVIALKTTTHEAAEKFKREIKKRGGAQQFLKTIAIKEGMLTEKDIRQPRTDGVMVRCPDCDDFDNVYVNAHRGGMALLFHVKNVHKKAMSREEAIAIVLKQQGAPAAKPDIAEPEPEPEPAPEPEEPKKFKKSTLCGLCK